MVQDRINNSIEQGIIPVCLVTPSVNVSSDYACFQNILDQFDDENKTCDCNVACHEAQFSSSVTVSTWPSNQYWENLALANNYSREEITARGPKAAEIRTELQQDYVKADVYYQSLNVQIIRQTPKYTDEGFFAGLGGALSLYLGMAIIMIFELLELFYDLFINIWNSGRRKPLALDK